MSGHTSPPPAERTARIEALARRLLATEAELRALTDGELDAILDPASSTPWLLRGAQAVLQQEEARSRRLVSRLPLIAAELSHDGVTRFVNDAVSTILGFEPDHLVGGRWWDDLGAPDEPATRLALQQLLEEDVAGREQAVVARNGEVRDVVWTSTMVPATAGGPASILLFGLDVTEQRRAEVAARTLAGEQAARREAETSARRADLLSEAGRLLGASLRYEATLTSIARLAVNDIAEYCIVDVVEASGDLRRIDVAHPAVDGRDPLRERLAREAPDMGALRIVPRVIRQAGRAVVHLVTEDDEGDVVSRRFLPRLAGRWILSAPLTARGHVLGALTLISATGAAAWEPRDVELVEELARRAALAVDNARLYEAALRASAAKSEFLAVMSHELRTPLNAIMGYSDLLLLGLPDPITAGSQKQVQRIRIAAAHLLQMIDEILTHSRMEAGEETVDLQATELCGLLRELAEMVEPLAETRNLELRCDTPNGDIPAQLDVRKVRQILLNLLGNAVKFTPRGSVVLTAHATDDTITVAVEDSGIGIAPENLERIFDPFWQVDQGRSRRSEGTGLGLNVALRLARLMDGDIRVTSSPGEGTKFELVLPWIRPAGSSE